MELDEILPTTYFHTKHIMVEVNLAKPPFLSEEGPWTMEKQWIDGGEGVEGLFI